MKLPKHQDIKLAYNRIKKYIYKTPVLTSSTIDEIAGCEIFFKCENFQKVGAFKFRGAMNSVLNLSEEEAQNGVAAHSSGNHAQALALAAKMRSIPAYIVMPENAPQVKKDATASYGAKITFCKPNLQAREETLAGIIRNTNAKTIHPYDYFDTIAGAGTSAFELVNEIKNLDVLIAPVGGGGLISGTALVGKWSNLEVFASEPEGADDAYRSFIKGEIVPSENPNTICDGLLTSLGKLNYEIIKNNVDEILLANDNEIISAMKLIYERLKIVVEPSCSVPLAVILKNKEKFSGKRVGLILSGGNIDLAKLPFT
jgi:threonine dehydratase